MARTLVEPGAIQWAVEDVSEAVGAALEASRYLTGVLDGGEGIEGAYLAVSCLVRADTLLRRATERLAHRLEEEG